MLNLAHGASPNWKRTLETLGRQFEAMHPRYADLRHFITTQPEGQKDDPLPWHNGMQVRPINRPIYVLVRSGFTSNAMGLPRSIAFAQGPEVAFREYVTGFYMDDDRPGGHEAYDRFIQLAQSAWDALPQPIRKSLVVPGYIDPSAQRESRDAWVAALYAIAWTSPESRGFKAKRTIHMQGESGVYRYDLEHLIGLPDPVPFFSSPIRIDESIVRANPGTPKAAHIAELFSRHPPHSSKSFAELGASVPPTSFAAILEPGIFLVSKMAIDWLVELPDPGVPERGSLVEPTLCVESAPAASPLPPPTNEFRQEGGNWRVSFAGLSGSYPDVKGMRYIAHLLNYPNPDKPIPAQELTSGKILEAGSNQPVTDKLEIEEAIARLKELCDALDKERGFYEDAELQDFEEEKRKLIKFLADTRGLGSKSRALGGADPGEKARKAVSGTLKTAYQQLESGKPKQPLAAAHFRDAIRTEGTAFAYRPGTTKLEWLL